MSSKSSKSVAVFAQIVLGCVFAGLLGLLSGLFTLYQPLADWVNNAHHSLWILGSSLIVVLGAMIAVGIWQNRTSKDGKEPLTSEDLGRPRIRDAKGDGRELRPGAQRGPNSGTE